jgi:hypothetical protein
MFKKIKITFNNLQIIFTKVKIFLYNNIIKRKCSMNNLDNNKATYHDYFILADKYYETAKLLLSILLDNNNPNCNCAIGNIEEATYVDKMCEINTKKSDITLYIPTLMLCFQSIELFGKGIVLLNDNEFKMSHNMDTIIDKIKSKYGKKSNIYLRIKEFYYDQIDIICNYKENNKIEKNDDLYASFRYPESIKKEYYDHFPLMYNGKKAKEQYKKLLKQMEDIRECCLNEDKLYRQNENETAE